MVPFSISCSLMLDATSIFLSCSWIIVFVLDNGGVVTGLEAFIFLRLCDNLILVLLLKWGKSSSDSVMNVCDGFLQACHDVVGRRVSLSEGSEISSVSWFPIAVGLSEIISLRRWLVIISLRRWRVKISLRRWLLLISLRRWPLIFNEAPIFLSCWGADSQFLLRRWLVIISLRHWLVIMTLKRWLVIISLRHWLVINPLRRWLVII